MVRHNNAPIATPSRKYERDTQTFVEPLTPSWREYRYAFKLIRRSEFVDD